MAPYIVTKPNAYGRADIFLDGKKIGSVQRVRSGSRAAWSTGQPGPLANNLPVAAKAVYLAHVRAAK